MRSISVLLFCLLSVNVYSDSIAVTLENDITFDSDDSYTHGT